MYRKISYVLFLLALLIIFSMNSFNATTDEAIIIAQSEIYPYSEEELSYFNGENNQPTYIAMDHIIYDVSNLEEWKDDLEDNSLAGKDVSKIINDPAIKELIIEKAPEVGILKD